MNVYFSVKTDFKTVLMVGGNFTEKTRLYLSLDDVYYITVLPLCAVFLPYTVKIALGKVVNNTDLASIYKMRNGEYVLRLKPRYAYVYSPSDNDLKNPPSLATQFFRAVKQKDISLARSLLTQDLNASIDDNALLCFFDDFTDIMSQDEDNMSAEQNCSYLVDKHNNVLLFRFSIINGKINDVSEISMY